MAQTLRAGNVFYFLFSAADQSLIDDTTVTVEDVPCSATPQAGAPYPQSLRIRFRLASGGTTLPRVRPLGPGLLSFVADADPSRVAPAPNDATPAGFDTWPTVGTMLLKMQRPAIDRIAALAALPVAPSHIWYSRVQLTQPFLFDSLDDMPIVRVLPNRTTPPALVTTAAGLRTAVSGFLKGRCEAAIAAGADAADDTLASIVEWPAVVAGTTGWIELIVSAAFDGAPFDGSYKDLRRVPVPGAGDFYDVAPGVTEVDPAHPRHGAIPARLVYRGVRVHASGNMTDAAAGSAIPDAVLAAGVTIPDYFPVRFTRVWQPVEDRSVHFPSQSVHVESLTTPSATFDQRLPSHGILWVPLSQNQRLVNALCRFTLTTPSDKPEHEMTWITGELARPFEYMGHQDPLDYDVAAGAIPHIILRRRMSAEVIYDRASRPVGHVCSYFSMRRAVRALVNNRVAGGRLNWETYYAVREGVKHTTIIGKNSSITRTLVREALGSAGALAVLDGNPDPNANPAGPAGISLVPALEALFHGTTTTQSITFAFYGLTFGPTLGAAAYFIWQSSLDAFQQSGGVAFDTVAEGRARGAGGAGALMALDVADEFVVNPETLPPRNAAIAEAAYDDAIVGILLADTLKPGAALQFWVNAQDLRDIRNKTPLAAARQPGHSPIFLAYDGPVGARTGFRVLDQNFQESPVVIVGAAGARKLQWLDHLPAVWCAANWVE